MTGAFTSGSAISLAPLLPLPVIALLAAVMLLLLAVAWWRRASGSLWRSLALVTLMVALVNPSWVSEQRQQLPDVAAIVVDRSPSQSIPGRIAATDDALSRLVDR